MFFQNIWNRSIVWKSISRFSKERQNQNNYHNNSNYILKLFSSTAVVAVGATVMCISTEKDPLIKKYFSINPFLNFALTEEEIEKLDKPKLKLNKEKKKTVRSDMIPNWDNVTVPDEYERIDPSLESKITSNNNLIQNTLFGKDKIEMLRVFEHKEHKSLMTVMKLGPNLCGHPNIIHGGATAAIFDNMFGWAFILSGVGAGFTANLNINYRYPLHHSKTVKMEIEIDHMEGRKVFLKGTLKDWYDDTVYAEGTSLFVVSRGSQLIMKLLFFLGLSIPASLIVSKKNNTNDDDDDDNHKSNAKGVKKLTNAEKISKKFEDDVENYERIDEKWLDKNSEYLKGHLIHETLDGHGKIEILRVFRKKDDNSIVAVTRFGEQMCGYPDLVHGGATAALFDNTYGWAFFLAEVGNGFTANLDVNYRKPFPVDTDAILKIKVDEVSGRKVWLSGSIEDPSDGTIFAESKSLFITSKKLASVRISS